MLIHGTDAEIIQAELLVNNQGIQKWGIYNISQSPISTEKVLPGAPTMIEVELDIAGKPPGGRPFEGYKQILSFRKNLFGIAFLPMAALLLFSRSVLADTLKTKNFRVTITNHCPEGYVACNNVTYYGVNLNTGASIKLTGRTVHTLCADGVTPCRFVGYEFSNGNYRYFVTEEGRLQVYRGGTLVLNQRGNWER